MFVSHQTSVYSFLDGIRLALEGGVKLVQLRMKNVPVEEIIETAKEAKLQCKKYNAKLIIDDYVDIVSICGLDGVHLGKDDMSIAEARQILGNIIIGATANTIEEVILAADAGADYIGLGPFSYTTTKQKLAKILGLEGYREIISEMKEQQILIPVYAIGGLKLEDIKPLLAIGVWGIAVSGAILTASNPVIMARKFCNFASEI